MQQFVCDGRCGKPIARGEEFVEVSVLRVALSDAGVPVPGPVQGLHFCAECSPLAFPPVVEQVSGQSGEEQGG